VLFIHRDHNHSPHMSPANQRIQSTSPLSGLVQPSSGANGHERLGEDAFGFMNILGYSLSARTVAVAHSGRYVVCVIYHSMKFL